ncbi:MAG: IS1595 family transposase [Pseudorhodoplanes sp.]|nr:IS1595 family transposase [Pseudorhodoplanes sp.]
MAKRPKAIPQMTTAQFENMFPDEAACKTYLQSRRWPEGVHCPRCGSAERVHPVKSMPFKWQCYSCTSGSGYRFSVIAGTIFENTNKPLRDWFRIVHLMLASKKGMSSLQIQRMMGFGSYETALHMTHKIRAALIAPETKLGGIVEVDDTWVGGKAYNKHGKRSGGGRGGAGSGKVPVIGAIERQGNVVARVLKRVSSRAAEMFVQETVSNKVSLIATDTASAYKRIGNSFPHGSVNHNIGQYVVGAVHTNTIEGFWSIFKRGIVGSYHKVSAKYLPLYVAEFQFRYNNRQNPDIFGAAIAGC